MDKEKNIENAKSYFVLAELLMILAGFFFVSYGVIYSTSEALSSEVSINMIEMYKIVSDTPLKNDSEINSANYAFLSSHLDALEARLNTASSISELSETYLLLGLILSIFSIISWGYAKYKLK